MACALPEPFTEAFAVLLALVAVTLPLAGAEDAAALAVLLPEAEAPPRDVAVAFDPVLAIANPVCDAEAREPAFAAVLARPFPTLAADVAVPATAATDRPR